jgi:hypothetical protein
VAHAPTATARPIARADGAALEQIFNGSVSVPEGVAQVVRRIDALESVGPQGTADLAKQRARVAPLFARAETTQAAIRYPAPSARGVGTAPVTAGSLVSATPGGVYTVRGAGAGVNSSGDGCTFAGAAFTLSRGTLTCRVTAIRAAEGATMADGAKVGLMARETLATLAASFGVELATGRGVHVHARPVDAGNFLDQKPGASAPGSAGLLGATGLLAADGQPSANYLLRPVWLRLVLDVNRWTAYTSLDGRTWLQAGDPVAVEFAGAWVGLFVTSHQPGRFITATFDHVAGFVPDTFVRIGAA